MGFTKLDENIVMSSIFKEDGITFKVWIALLATCEQNGISPTTIPYLSGLCRVDEEEIEISIEKLSSPDKYSKSNNDEGKRIRKVNGGFEIINYLNYRDYSYSDSPDAVRMRKKREGEKNEQKRTCSNIGRTSLSSVSVINSSNISNNINNQLIASNINNQIESIKESTDNQIINIYNAYPRKKGKGQAVKAIASALKKISFEDLLLKVEKFAIDSKNKDPQYIPHPATWFNGERWLDEPDEAISRQLPKRPYKPEQEEWTIPKGIRL